MAVSILAHPERWALLDYRDRSDDTLCFNPRPPRKVGATRRERVHRRRRGRFNPRPPRKVGATCRGHRGRLGRWLFQSSPTPKGGRYHHLRLPLGA